MRRPVGVVVAGVFLGLMALLGICGTLLALGFAIFFHNPILPSAFRPFIIFSDSLVLFFFLYCAWTVIDLFRMRTWARISMVVIGALVFLFSAVAGFGILAVRKFAPMGPPGQSPGTMSLVFVGIAGFYFLISVIGAWWMVYFNLAHVRGAFARERLMVSNPAILPPGGAAMLTMGVGEGISGWRVVIIVWACLMLLSVLCLPMVLLMHIPLFLYGVVLTGTAGTVAVLVLVAVEVYMGIGLLMKWKAAWYVGLAWQIYTVGYCLSFLIPGTWARFLAYQQDAAARWSPTPPAPYPVINMSPFLTIGFIAGSVIVILCTIALFQRKADYLGS
jgi:hypothetical protein